jgi:hypothetical protein
VTEETTEQLKRLLPQSLDDIVRENRDQLRLALATEEELSNLKTALTSASVRHTLTTWNVLMLHATTASGQVSSPRLVGRVVDSGESWITSHVVGFDFAQGLVQTKSSFYRIIGLRADEKDTDLLQICAALHEWGLGRRFGVPHIFY